MYNALYSFSNKYNGISDEEQENLHTNLKDISKKGEK